MHAFLLNCVCFYVHYSFRESAHVLNPRKTSQTPYHAFVGSYSPSLNSLLHDQSSAGNQSSLLQGLSKIKVTLEDLSGEVLYELGDGDPILSLQ